MTNFDGKFEKRCSAGKNLGHQGYNTVPSANGLN